MFTKGFQLIYKHNNQPAYEKVTDDVDGLWVALNGFYVVKEQHTDTKTGEMFWIDVSYPESDLPLFRKDGSLNRTGFKWNDKMVEKYYTGIMIFSGVVVP